LDGKGEYNAGIACCLMSKTGAKPYVIKSRIGQRHPFITQDGEDREDNPNQYIANMRSGAKAGFRYFSIHNLGMVTVLTRGNGHGVMNISLDAEEKPFAQIPVAPSREWKSFSGEVCLEDGVKSLWFSFEGDGAIDFKSFRLNEK